MAGHSRRLYTDGVFHSQYNPKRPLTHGVWDLLMLPALYSPVGALRRVLVLGVGGGAVIRLLHHFIQPDKIVGIELNATHLKIAKRFFGINKNIATLHHADAIKWLENYRGPAFDLIIDDLFGEVDGEPQRVVPLNTRWCALLHRQVSKSGVIVINSMSAKILRESAFVTNTRLSNQYASKLQLSLPVYENAVGAFFRKATDKRQLKQHLSTICKSNVLQGLDYRVRKIMN